MVEQTWKPKDFIPVSAPVHHVECQSAFEQLDQKEAAYAYHMAGASWIGSIVCWFQRSYEAPGLFIVLSLFFKDGVDKTKERALLGGITEQEWDQFLVYAASVFNNCGNFKSFGDTKFVPEMPEARFQAILETSPFWASGEKHGLQETWNLIKREVYYEENPLRAIGFPDKGGQTSYYSSNITSEDAKFVDEFCQQEKISPLNTFLYLKDGEYTLCIYSAEADYGKLGTKPRYEFRGKVINIRPAVGAEIMSKVVEL